MFFSKIKWLPQIAFILIAISCAQESPRGIEERFIEKHDKSKNREFAKNTYENRKLMIGSAIDDEWVDWPIDFDYDSLFEIESIDCVYVEEKDRKSVISQLRERYYLETNEDGKFVFRSFRSSNSSSKLFIAQASTVMYVSSLGTSDKFERWPCISNIDDSLPGQFLTVFSSSR